MDKPIERKTWTFKRIAGIGGVGIFVFAILYTIVWGDHSSKLNVELPKITVSTVVNDDFQEFIPITGNVLPIKTVFLDAIEGGAVERRFVEEGAFVSTGDTILQLANTNLLLDIMNREAQLFEQINNLRNTRLAMEENRLTLEGQLLEIDYLIKQKQQKLNRTSTLVKQEMVSQEEFEDIRDEARYLENKKKLTVQSHRQDSLFRAVQVEQLEASVHRMNANLSVVKRKIENLFVRAPIKGQLTSLNAEIGELKSAGENLGQIDVLDAYKVRCAIDEHYITRVFIGQRGEFTLAGSQYDLIVKKVYPEVENGSFEVDMQFDGATPADIRRGQTLHIRLELSSLTQALLLARGSFYQKTGGNWVFVVDPSGDYAVRRNVRLGRQNPDFYEVLEGLSQGEVVITSSYDTYENIEKLILQSE